MTDQDALDALDRTAAALRADFRAALLEDLRQEWQTPTIVPDGHGTPRRRPVTWLAAAAVVAALVGTVVAVTRPSTPDRSPSSPATTPTTLGSSDSQPAPTTNPTASTTPPTSIAEDACVDVAAAPTVLPDGTEPGSAVLDEVDGADVARWGTGSNQVTQLLRTTITDVRFDTGPGVTGVITGLSLDLSVFVRSGNPPAAPITIQTRDPGGCVREYQVGPGVTINTASGFARNWRFFADDRRPKVAPTDGSTVLAARTTDLIAHPTATVADLFDIDPALVTMAPTGQIVGGRRVGERIALTVLTGGGWRDTDVAVAARAEVSPHLEFGPAGDLYVISITPNDTGDDVEITQVDLSSDGDARVIDRTNGTADPGRCAPVVEPGRVGCTVGQGPGLDIDPPQPFDRARIDPSLTTVERSGSNGDRTWQLSRDQPLEGNCIDGSCIDDVVLGPDGKVLWSQTVEDPQAPTNRVAYVLDDRPIAGVVWLDSSVHTVVGFDGTDLLATVITDTARTIERFDLGGALAQRAESTAPGTLELTRPKIDLEWCRPTWARQRDWSLGGAYVWGVRDGLPLQVFVPAGGTVTGTFAVAVRSAVNLRFDPTSANAEVDGRPARLLFATPTWGELLWALPDGTDAYLRTSTMTGDELIALANTLTPRPADDAIPGFDTTDDRYTLADQAITPVTAGIIIETACAPDGGGWMTATVIDRPLAQALFLTDRPAIPLATQLLDDGRLLVVTGRDDIAGRSADALAAVRDATDREWANLTSADPATFEPNTPLAPPTA